MRQKKLCSFFCRQSPARNPRKKRADHSFYHRQTRNTRKQWTKNAPIASVLERKRHESTQSAREDRPTSVGVVEVARSSRVTQTKKPSSLVQNAQIRGLFLIKNASFLLVLHNGFIFVSECGSDGAFLLRIFYEFIPKSSTKTLFGAFEKLRFRCALTVFCAKNFFDVCALSVSLYGN